MCCPAHTAEPGTNMEIKKFAETKYGVTFPLFSKVDVNGAGEQKGRLQTRACIYESNTLLARCKHLCIFDQITFAHRIFVAVPAAADPVFQYLKCAQVFLCFYLSLPLNLMALFHDGLSGTSGLKINSMAACDLY